MPLILLNLLKSPYTYVVLLILGVGAYVKVLHYENQSLKTRLQASAQVITQLTEANKIDQGSITALQQANVAWSKQATNDQQKALGLEVATQALQQNYDAAIKDLKAKQAKDTGPLLNVPIDSSIAQRLRSEASNIH